MAIIDVLESIILASSLSKQEKLPVLKTASMKLDIVKVLFSLGKDLKIIENKKYMELESGISEIGKMLGGWIKTTST